MRPSQIRVDRFTLSGGKPTLMNVFWSQNGRAHSWSTTLPHLTTHAGSLEMEIAGFPPPIPKLLFNAPGPNVLTGATVVRLPDEIYDGSECFALNLVSNFGEDEMIWINKRSYLIHGLREQNRIGVKPGGPFHGQLVVRESKIRPIINSPLPSDIFSFSVPAPEPS